MNYKPSPGDKVDGFKVRAGSGSSWTDRKLDPKSENRVVPLKPTPFMDAVMSGSPDQVRFDNGSKELGKGLDTAAARPDVFAPLSF